MPARATAILAIVAMAALALVLLGRSDRPALPSEHTRGAGAADSAPATVPAAAEAEEPARAEPPTWDPCSLAGSPVQDSGADAGAQALEAQRAATGRLSDSSDAEHLAAAALLSIDSGERVEHAIRAATAGGDRPVLLWIAANACSHAAEDQRCAELDIERRLLQADGQNAEAWMLAAVRRLRGGDAAGALAAMERAAAAAESRAYFPEKVELVERALAAEGTYTFPDRVTVAFGAAATSSPAYAEHIRVCRDRSAESLLWARACLAYGELGERRNETEIGKMIAREIQIAALEQLGDRELLDATVARRDAARAARSDRDARDVIAVMVTVFTPGGFNTYLNRLRQLGETSAFEAARNEGEPLLREIEHADCGR